jgi:hypothetical protein
MVPGGPPVGIAWRLRLTDRAWLLAGAPLVVVMASAAGADQATVTVSSRPWTCRLSVRHEASRVHWPHG